MATIWHLPPPARVGEDHLDQAGYDAVVTQPALVVLERPDA
jgi:hypothetical protein